MAWMVSMVDYHKNSKTVAVPRLQTVEPQHGDCSFYRWITEYILSGCAGSCSALTWKSRQREVKAVRHNNTTDLPPKEELYVQGSRNRANRIKTDPQHPGSRLFQLLPSGQCYCSIGAAIPDCSFTVGLFWYKHTLTIIFAHRKVHITPSF